MSKSLYFYIIFALLAVLFGLLFIPTINRLEVSGLAGQIISSISLYSDFLLFAGVVALLVNGARTFRVLGYTIFILFVLIYSTQFAAVYLTGEYISPTAIANFRHIGLILTTSKAFIAFLICTFLLILTITAEKFFTKSAGKNLLMISLLCIAVAGLLKLDKYWLTNDIFSTGEKPNHSDSNALVLTSPITALLKSYKKTQFKSDKSPLSKAELSTATEFGIVFNTREMFPLVKDYIYKSDLPFPVKDNLKTVNRPFNIIVFFTEGLSARIIQPYNNQYQNLTPNIAEFATRAMRVDNYYNHTFATYRGLLGQLCSIFPVYASGKINLQTDYYCLGNLLNRNDYDTYFLHSQQKAKTNLGAMFSKANLSHIMAEDSLRKLYLGGEVRKRSLALSDQQFFKTAINHIQTLEQRQKVGEQTPFFVGLYNIETHAFYHMSDDGVKYEEQDKYILHSIHNYDDAFGKFWQYFKQSDLYANTIVILTSDHTHFQGKDYVSLVKNQSDYMPHFVDRIPLLIYHPGLELPASYDAQYASSIDFAPTLAHLMKFDNRPNSFLGNSIFERSGKKGLAYGDGYIYVIDENGIKTQNQYFKNPQEETSINQMYKVINNIHHLEVEGLIWNKNLDK